MRAVVGLKVSGSPIGVVAELGERTRPRLEGVGLGEGIVVLASAVMPRPAARRRAEGVVLRSGQARAQR